MSESYRILALFEPAGFVDNPGLNGFEVRQRLQQFMADSPWDETELWRVIRREVVP